MQKGTSINDVPCFLAIYTLSCSITSNFWGYLGPPYLPWYHTSLMNVPKADDSGILQELWSKLKTVDGLAQWANKSLSAKMLWQTRKLKNAWFTRKLQKVMIEHICFISKCSHICVISYPKLNNRIRFNS